jgi:hypothetical protein
MTDHARYLELLGLYALGALDPREAADVEAHLPSCAECRSELELMRGDAALLALSAVGPAPPQRARQRLLTAIANEPRRQLNRSALILGRLRPNWLSFAPIAAALLLAIFSLMLWRVDSKLQRRTERLQSDLQQTRDELRKSQEMVALLHSPDSMHLTLVKTQAPPQSQAKMFYSPKMGKLLMVANNMEPLPGNKVYQLWLLPMKGGSPMPCGTFRPDAKGNVMMEHPLEETGIEAKGFAITIEPENGSNTPTLPIEMINAG